MIAIKVLGSKALVIASSEEEATAYISRQVKYPISKVDVYPIGNGVVAIVDFEREVWN